MQDRQWNYTSNISKKSTDTMIGQWESNRKPPMSYRLATWLLTLDMTLNRSRSGHRIFRFSHQMSRIRERYNIGHNGWQKGNHRWAFDWHLALWTLTLQWMTFKIAHQIFRNRCMRLTALRRYTFHRTYLLLFVNDWEIKPRALCRVVNNLRRYDRQTDRENGRRICRACTQCVVAW